MPKMKSNRAMRKRTKATGSGKFVRRSPKLRHLLSGKRPKVKRRLTRAKPVHRSDRKRVKALIGKH